MNIAVFGAGCFWCVEAIFTQLTGVESVVSGYCNGDTLNPTYESVCSGTTGHAEVCKITYDSNIISFKKPPLLNVSNFLCRFRLTVFSYN